MADDRTYIRVHDGIDEHAKIEGLSDAAFRLLISSWAYCSRNLNDGRITTPAWRKRGAAKARRELIEIGLAVECDGYVEMHDYLEHQRSAEEVREIKAARGAGGTLGNHIRWHVKRRKPDPDCEHCIANRSQDRSGNRSQTDRSPIANRSHRTEAEADTEENSFQGGSHVSRADASAPPLFPDHCQRHANVAEPGNCGGCADARKARAVMPRLSLVSADEVFERPPWCGTCDEFTRKVEVQIRGRDAMRNCKNCHPLAEEAS